MAKRTVDATELQPGDRIQTGKGQTAVVTAPTRRGRNDTVEICTDRGWHLTTNPCPVRVVD